MSKEYTDEELMGRVNDMEEIKKVAYKRVYYIANEDREKELEDLWVSDPALQKNASYGKNTGYYVGMDSIRKYYVDHHKEVRMEDLKRAAQADPSIAVTEDNLYVGTIVNRPVSTGLVEIAGDGKTAKALFYSIGQETVPNGDGTAKALWEPGKVAYDFVREADGWKIWHVVEANDLYCEAGTDYSKQEVYHNYETNPVDIEFGEPDVKEITHNTDFNWWDNYPFPPKPYETWSDEISYGPEGYVRPAEYGLDSKEGRNWK